MQFVDVVPRTADRRVHLVPEDLDREAPGGLYAYRGDPGSPEFPLALVSPATDRTISSTLGELVAGIASLDIHPADAGPRGIAHGAPVRLHNAGGEVRCLDDFFDGYLKLPRPQHASSVGSK